MTARAIPQRPKRRRRWRQAGPRAAFVAVLGLGLASTVAALLVFAWPPAESAPRPLLIGFQADELPDPGGDPVAVAGGRFWLVNLRPEDGQVGKYGAPTAGGLLALSWRDSHKGCSITWRPELRFATANGVSRTGWFRDPCSGSIYTRGGVQVWGPSPRSMDTYALDVKHDGVVVVNVGMLALGADDNPTRAVAYSPPLR